MTTQTEAQRLAERVQDLSSMFKTPSHERGICNQSAALLLRQDELLKQSLEALDAVRSNMRMNAPQLAGKVWGFADDVSASIRAHLGGEMKPTQRDSYESLWNALHEIDSAVVFLPTFEVTHDGGIEAVTKNIVDAIKKAVVALERFGAGGGEPMFWYRPCSNGMYEGPIHDAQIESVRRESGAWKPLFPHPSPADLRAEYLRGLEDAKKIASNYGPSRPIVTKTPSQRIVGRWEGEQAASAGIADAIEALKGKQ